MHQQLALLLVALQNCALLLPLVVLDARSLLTMALSKSLPTDLSSTHARLAVNNKPICVPSSNKDLLAITCSYLKFCRPLWTYLSFDMENLLDHCICDLRNYIISPQNMFPGTKKSFSF